MTRNTNSPRERGASNKKQNAGENPCKFPLGVKIIGELGAKFWLQQNQTIEEGGNDVKERIHSHDSVGTPVP